MVIHPSIIGYIAARIVATLEPISANHSRSLKIGLSGRCAENYGMANGPVMQIALNKAVNSLACARWDAQQAARPLLWR